jgi:hypothetical protein
MNYWTFSGTISVWSTYKVMRSDNVEVISHRTQMESCDNTRLPTNFLRGRHQPSASQNNIAKMKTERFFALNQLLTSVAYEDVDEVTCSDKTVGERIYSDRRYPETLIYHSAISRLPHGVDLWWTSLALGHSPQ